MAENYSRYSTIGGGGITVSLGTDKNVTQPAPAPSGLIVTNAVQTKDGWRGQVIVDKDIVWESEPIPASTEAKHDAIGAANQRVVEAIKRLFETTTPADNTVVTGEV